MRSLFAVIFCSTCWFGSTFSQLDLEPYNAELYTVEGKVYPPDSQILNNWQSLTRIIVNGGEFLGFLK